MLAGTAHIPAATVGVVPVLIGPIQVLLALLPAIGAAVLAVLVSLFKPATAKKAARLLWRLKLYLVAIAAVVVAGVYVVGVAFPPGTGPIGRLEAGEGGWPLFRGGLARTGYLPPPAAMRRRAGGAAASSPGRDGLNWTFTADPTFHASAAVVGNRLFVTSAVKEVFADRGRVYCLDADTGGLVWANAPDGFLATFSSPAVQGKYLVSGEGLHYTRNARIVCLDLSRKGKLLWQYRTSSHVESSPCIHNGRAYIGAGDDGYYCFQLEPGADGKAQRVWHAGGDDYPDAETSPAVADGKVYVGLGMDGQAVCCLDADTGRQLWRTPTPYPVFTPPTLAGGSLYVGMGNGNFIDTAEQARAKTIRKLKEQGNSAEEIARAEKRLGPAGEVWCLDPDSGQVRWRFKTDRTILGAVAADLHGPVTHLYFATRGGETYCITTSGKRVATWNAYEPILASPAVCPRYVYYVTEGGMLYALDKETFTPAWEKALGATGPFLSSPVVARGRVYVGSQKDGFLCVARPHGGKRRRIWAGALGGPGKTGLADAEPLPERAALLWRYPPRRKAPAGATQPAESRTEDKLLVRAPAAVFSRVLCVPVARGPQKGLLCLNRDDATRDTPAVLWHFPTPHGVHVSPVGDDERIFFVDGRCTDQNRRLFCLDARTGKRLWQRPLAGETRGQGASRPDDAPRDGRIAFTDEVVFVQDGPADLACLETDGRVRWRRSVGRLTGSVAWQGLILVAAVAQPPRLLALDLPTGRTLWSVSLAESGGRSAAGGEVARHAPSCGPIVMNNRIYLGTSTGVAARRLVDGGTQWQADTGRPNGPLVADRFHLAYRSVDGELIVLSLAPLDENDRGGRAGEDTGPSTRPVPSRVRLRLKVEAGDAASPPVPPLLTRGGVIYAARRGLMRREFSADRARRWMSTSLLGGVTSPIVAAGGRVYFACHKRGFVCGGRWRR